MPRLPIEKIGTLLGRKAETESYTKL